MDKELKRKQTRERVQRYREKKGSEAKAVEDKKAKVREGTRLRVARHRDNNKIPDICEVCGHKGVTDIHHEGEAREIHYLCPNCHAEITRCKITLQELKGEAVTLEGNANSDVTQYPAILHALTDPVKRRKLEKITESIKNHNVLKEVTYGAYGPDFQMVGEMLEVTATA